MSEAQDLLLAFYERQREHELELNRAQAALEQGLLRNALLLNGAAATAYLTFVGSTDAGLPTAPMFLATLGTWSAGLFISVLGFNYTLKGQAAYAAAYKWRRRAIERVILTPALEEGGLQKLVAAAALETDPSAALLGHPEGRDGGAAATTMAREATSRRRSAGHAIRRGFFLARLASIAFLVGVVLGTASVVPSVRNAAGAGLELREGGNPTKLSRDGAVVSAVPRHVELPPAMVRAIERQTGVRLR
jgi:hypothetical protein